MAVEQATQYTTLEFRTLFISHLMDSVRHLEGGKEGEFSSHNASVTRFHPDTNVVICNDLKRIKQVEEAEVVIVDESQFFDGLVLFVKDCVQSGKIIQVYGLSSNYKLEKFGEAIG